MPDISETTTLAFVPFDNVLLSNFSELLISEKQYTIEKIWQMYLSGLWKNVCSTPKEQRVPIKELRILVVPNVEPTKM